MTTEKRLRQGPVVLDYSTKPATVYGTVRVPEDNLPELRHLLDPKTRTERTILAAFVIRLKRQPVVAEMTGLLSFAVDATAERMLTEIDAMGAMPIATLADVEIRLPGE